MTGRPDANDAHDVAEDLAFEDALSDDFIWKD